MRKVAGPAVAVIMGACFGWVGAHSSASAAFLENSLPGAILNSSASDGGLKGRAAFLNSDGYNPLAYSYGFNVLDQSLVYRASFSDGRTYSNENAPQGAGYGGLGRSTAAGETFVSNGGNLLSFEIFLRNLFGSGDVNFVIAPFGRTGVSGPALFSELINVETRGWVSTGPLNLELVAGKNYIAFLTVSDLEGGRNPLVLPLPSSAPLLGSALLLMAGWRFVGRRTSKKAVV